MFTVPGKYKHHRRARVLRRLGEVCSEGCRALHDGADKPLGKIFDLFTIASCRPFPCTIRSRT